MWAGYVALALFVVACSCMVAAIWEHDGPMWAAVFLAVIVCALTLGA